VQRAGAWAAQRVWFQDGSVLAVVSPALERAVSVLQPDD